MTNTQKAVFIMIIAGSSFLFNSRPAWPEISGTSVERDSKADKGEVPALLKEGGKLYRDAKYVEAGQSFKKALEIDPTNGYAGRMLSLCRHRLIYKGKRYQAVLGDDKKALGYFEAAQEILPEKSEDVDSLISEIDLKHQRSKEGVIDKRNDVEKGKMLLDIDKTWLKSSIKNLKDFFKKDKTAAAPDDINDKLNRKIRIVDFNNASLRDVLKNLSELSGVNIVLDENAMVGVMPEGLTVYLTEVSLADAIEIILRSSGLKYRIEKSYILVTTPDKLNDESMSMKVYDVQDIVGRLYDFSADPLQNQGSSAASQSQDNNAQN